MPLKFISVAPGFTAASLSSQSTSSLKPSPSLSVPTTGAIHTSRLLKNASRWPPPPALKLYIRKNEIVCPPAGFFNDLLKLCVVPLNNSVMVISTVFAEVMVKSNCKPSSVKLIPVPTSLLRSFIL